MDFSEIVIEQMRVKHPNLEWRVEDVRRLALEDSSFDIAIDKASSMRFLGPTYTLADLGRELWMQCFTGHNGTLRMRSKAMFNNTWTKSRGFSDLKGLGSTLHSGSLIS